MSKVNTFALNRTEIYDREIEGLTKRIDELNRGLRGVYTTGVKNNLRKERDRLVADRVTLRQKRKAYVMRSTNPFERLWNFLRAHPIFALFLVFLSVMVPAGPQAIAGYLMITGTIWFLMTAFRGIRRHYERRLDAKTAVSSTIMHVPGGILEVQGQVPPHKIEAIQKEWEAARRAGGASIVVVEGTHTQFRPGGPVLPFVVSVPEDLVIPDRVSAMHADDAPVVVDDSTDGVHPPLPSWMRTAWDTALAEYRERVKREGELFKNVKEEFTELYRGVWPRDVMIEWAHDGVTPRHLHEPPPRSTLNRIERDLESISDEGAKYGELLFRAAKGEDIRKYVTEDDEIILRGQRAVASPEMPRSFVPMLDRAFELTTDCRYHHVAEHGLVETDLHPGYVVRTCTVCSPATFWIERA